MQKRHALFRCDASAVVGGGHVMRCLTLASELNAHGWRCSFACTDETVSFMPALSQSGHGVVSADDMIDNVDVLIVDHYGLDRVYEEKCRVWAKQIVVIDDLADRLHDCDVLIDQNFGSKKSKIWMN